jgi:ABC-type phosphonate transport system ATPase subunit
VGGVGAIPTEEANEELLGPPTVVVNKLRKTFGAQVSVNDLTFKMYENQIIAIKPTKSI